MNYQETMGGLQQIFDAILSQQLQQPPVEVDEMTMGQQSIADSLSQINPMGGGMDIAGRAAAAMPSKAEKKGNIPFSMKF